MTLHEPDVTTDFTAYLDERRRLIDERLAEYAQNEPGCPSALAAAMRYSLLAPGKRLRPLLVLLAAEASGGTLADALPAACALEMVHAYSLIHDDLPAMDDDDLRRGRPTCHKQFGEATAILAGDALLTLAFEVIARQITPSTLAAHCCGVLARAAGKAGMVGGQMADLQGENGSSSPIATLESIHRRKTGALFTAALRIGGNIGCQRRGCSPEECEPQLAGLESFGESLGLAFQISDDLLDVESTAEQTGKRVGKDAGRGKLTYPGLLGVAESRRRLTEVCHAARASLAELGEAGRYLVGLVDLVERRDR